MNTIGDLSRTLLLNKTQTRLRQELDTLAVEVATGFVKDTAKHLRGDLSGVLSIDRTLARLDVFRVNLTEAAVMTNGMQMALGGIQDRSEALAQVITNADLTPSSAILDAMSEDALDAFDRILSSLNASVGGRALFAGVQTDGLAVTDAQGLIAQIVPALSGLSTLPEIEDALDQFFAPGNAFETDVYQGADQNLTPLQLSETDHVRITIRADRSEIREIVKSVVLAALSADHGYSTHLRTEMLGKAGTGLQAAVKPLVDMRAELGLVEARIEETTSRNEAERTSLSLARLQLTGIDDYEKAARYEDIRGKLESLYAISARSSRLSLAAYL